MNFVVLRTHAWYVRLAQALVRSYVMNTAGSKAWCSSYSTSWSDQSSSWVWLAHILFGSRSRSFLWAITRSLARLLTNLTRSGRGGEGSALVSSGTGLGSPTRWETAISSTCNGGGGGGAAQLHPHIVEFEDFLVRGAWIVFRQPKNPHWVTPPMLLKIVNWWLQMNDALFHLGNFLIFPLAISLQGVDLGAECLDGSVQFRGDWVKVIFEQRLKDQRKSLSKLLQLQASKERGAEIFHYSRLQPGPPSWDINLGQGLNGLFDLTGHSAMLVTQCSQHKAKFIDRFWQEYQSLALSKLIPLDPECS